MTVDNVLSADNSGDVSIKVIEDQLKNKDITPAQAVVGSTGIDNPEGTKFKNFNHYFKKLIPPMIEKLNPNFVNTNNTIGGLLYTAVVKMGNLTEKTVLRIADFANQVYIAGLSAPVKINDAHDGMVLFGQKMTVLKVRKQIDDELRALGVSFENLLINKAYFEKDFPQINKYLRKKSQSMGFVGVDPGNEQDAEILLLDDQKASPEIKKDIVKKIVWPKLKAEIQKAMSHMLVADTLKNSDTYIKMLSNFAKTNEMSPDSIYFMLNKDPQSLLTLKSAHKIKDSAAKIIEAVNKYTDFTNSNIHMARFYTGLANTIINKYLTPEEQKNIREEKFIVLNGQDNNLNDIEEKLALGPDQKELIDKIAAKRPHQEMLNIGFTPSAPTHSN